MKHSTLFTRYLRAPIADCPRLLSLLAGVAIWMPLSLQPLQAQTEREWSNTAGGDWATAGNWVDDTVPSEGERAIFGLGQDPAYTVTLGDTRDIGSLHVDTDRMNLSVATGETLTLTDEAAGDFNDNSDAFDATSSLMIGRGNASEDHTGTMTLSSGTLTVQSLLLGGTNGSFGELHITGSNTVFNQTGTDSNDAVISYRGDAILRVSDGAEANFGFIRMARRLAPNVSQIIVEDEGSVLTYSTRLEVSYRNPTEVIVRDGGTLIGNGRTRIAERGSPALFTIDNASAEFNATVEMGVHENTGTLRIINGSTVEVTDSMYVGFNTSGASPGGGVVEVIGEDSLLTSTHTVALGGTPGSDNGGVGRLTVEEDGLVQLTATLQSWSQGTVEIRSGGRVEASNYQAVSGSVFTMDGGSFQANAWNADADSVFQLTLHTGQFDAPIILGDEFLGGGDATITDSLFELSLEAGFSADLEDVFEVMHYFGDLTGTFAGLSEGDVLTANGYEFQIGYGSGNNDMITLTVIPEPGAVAMLLLAAGLLGLRRRTRF